MTGGTMETVEMSRPAERSIRKKLTIIVFFTCGAAILLACAIFAVYDVVTFEVSLKNELKTVADITGSNSSAALTFGDAAAAAEILRSLRAQKHIVEACVYQPNGTVLAAYRSSRLDRSAAFPKPEPDLAEIRGGHIVVFHTIRLNGERIGTIYLKSDLQELHARVVHFSEIFAVIILLSLSTAYLLSSNLQRAISEPILDLARAAFAVSLHKDYSIRATKRSADEVGFLYDRFNEMMSQIQRREQALEEIHAELELRVDERTKALQKEVAERNQAQQELADRTDFLNSLIQNSPLAIIVIGREHRLLMCNPAFESLFGCRQTEILGRPIEEIVGADPQESQRITNQVISGQQVHFITRRKRSDGSMIDVELYAVPLLSNGKVVRTLGMYHDITERVRADEALVRAKEAAEAASRAKSEFLANMSHEIRTPMNGIIGMTDLALDTRLSREQREYLSMVKSSAHSLLGVLNDILDFSKIEAGKLDLEIAPFHLRQSLGETLKALAFRAHEKELELIWRVNDDVPDALEGDVGRLRQVLVNLVGNALKFTQAGEVSVEVEQQAASPDAAIDGAIDGAMLHFRVRDTGIGIPEEKQAVIFDAFTQADNSTTRKYGGTGLGLSICSRLVKMMGGQIWVESQMGQGSTFHFTIRVGIADRSESTKQQPEAQEPQSQQVVGRQPATPLDNVDDKSLLGEMGARCMTVLLAEDNAVNRLVAKRLLEKHGHAVLVAENGAEAVSTFEGERERIDAILMDIQMPEMDGLTAIRAIRAKEKDSKHHVPIIALTAHAMKGDREKCLAAGADDYITKPLQTSDLIAALARARAQSAVAFPQHERTPAPQPETQTGHAKIDWATALDRMDGDRDLLAEVARLFIDEWPTTKAEIDALLEKRDLKAAERLVHGLKGAAANLGAQNVSESAFRVEKLARSGDYQQARHEWERAKCEAEHLVGEIGSLLVSVPN